MASKAFLKRLPKKPSEPSYGIREVEAESQFCKQVTVDVINQVVPLTTMEAIIAECRVGEQRTRKLPALLTMVLCIAMQLFSELCLSYVLVRMVRGSRLLSDVGVAEVATKGPISRARYRLGVKPLEQLFKRVCHPVATAQTPGAFAYGMRLVAIDGTTEDVADTPHNAAYFGRHHADRGAAAFPQLQCVYLCECGTHVIFDAAFWPCHTSEHKGVRRLLRSVTHEMLVMWDRGLYAYDHVSAVRERGAQVLCRLSAAVKPQALEYLSDGSYLAYIDPINYTHRKRGERLLVRIMEYTIADPDRPGHGEIHRLLTPLLDPDLYPALALIGLYHERWEIEITIDEIDTHQRLLQTPFRSLRPVGVIQELYGLLLAHFIIRFIMYQAAARTQLDPDRLSFINSLRLISDALADFQLVHPDQHARLWSRLLDDILHFQLPPRDTRINPRVVKRKMSKFKKKRPEHLHPPPPASFHSSIVMLGQVAYA